MRKLFIFFLTTLALHFACNLHGQSTIQVTGYIKDQSQKGLDLAMVSLLRLPDSSFVKSEFTDQDGSFLLTEISPGPYIIQVNLLGFETYDKAINLDSDTDLPIISLSPSINLISEVTVTAKKPYIERKIDRTIVNVDALIANAGSDILEVLERAPGISVDNNGSILLKGRGGVAIFINDKPSYLSGQELESYLRSLPAGTVQRIEIMTNPPAKYEAAGNSGVINIVLKKNKIQGFNGNISASYRKSRYHATNNSANLSYNKDKLSLNGNFSGGLFNSFQDLNINRHYRNEVGDRLSSFAQNSFNKRGGNYLNAGLGLDYFINDHTSVGSSFKWNTSPSSRNNDNKSRVSDPQGNLTQRVVADNQTDASFRNTIYNIYLSNKNDEKGQNISFDADYASYNSGSQQLFKNYIYNTEDVLIFQDLIGGDLPSNIGIFAAKSDYSKSFKDESKFEAGLKTAFTKTDNEAKYSTTIDNITTPDFRLSNRFLYDELISAAYVNYSKSFGRISLQVGLRVESTQLTGHQIGNVESPESSFKRNYTTGFPTFYASWKVDTTNNHVLTFSYGRRIDRPYFQDLNPFISPLDKFTFYSGNPNLLPTFSHNLSLSHSFKTYFTTSVNYSKTVDGINETLEIRDGIYYSRPGNIASSQSLSLSLEGSVPVTKWYNINSYLELTHQRFDSPLYTEQLNSRGTYYFISATNSFTFGKGWSGDVSGQYRSDLVYAQLLLKSFNVVNLGLQKKIFNNTANIKLSINDLFYTRRGNGIINNLQLTNADWNSKYDSRVATITFSWRFGKSTLKKERYNGGGSNEEQGRVKG